MANDEVLYKNDRVGEADNDEVLSIAGSSVVSRPPKQMLFADNASEIGERHIYIKGPESEVTGIFIPVNPTTGDRKIKGDHALEQQPLICEENFPQKHLQPDVVPDVIKLHHIPRKKASKTKRYIWIGALVAAFLIGILVGCFLVFLILDKPPKPLPPLPAKEYELAISKTDNTNTDITASFLRLDTINSCAYLSGIHENQMESAAICYLDDDPASGLPLIIRYPNKHISIQSTLCGRLNSHNFCCWTRQSTNRNALTDTKCFKNSTNTSDMTVNVTGMQYADVIGSMPGDIVLLGLSAGEEDVKFVVFRNNSKEIRTIPVAVHFFQRSFAPITLAFARGSDVPLLALVEKNGQAHVCTYSLSRLQASEDRKRMLTTEAESLEFGGSFELPSAGCRRVPLQLPSQRNAINRFRFCSTDDYLSLVSYERSSTKGTKQAIWDLQVWFKERNVTSSVSHPMPNTNNVQLEFQCKPAEINIFVTNGKSLQRHKIKLPMPLSADIF